MITTIGFDADDTLWHNESIFEATHAKYRALLARWHDAGTVDRQLLATELRNLELYGYGIKAHALSCIETAIDLSGGAISAAEAVARLADGHRLVLITKGDLRDQERKLAKSGLAPHFEHTEIVAEKDAGTYARILDRLGVRPEQFLMVGNSIKSDILPALDLGACAVQVPYPLLWEGEASTRPPPSAAGRYFQVASLRELPALVERLHTAEAKRP